jgi:hypothetical protein
VDDLSEGFRQDRHSPAAKAAARPLCRRGWD